MDEENPPIRACYWTLWIENALGKAKMLMFRLGFISGFLALRSWLLFTKVLRCFPMSSFLAFMINSLNLFGVNL